MNRNVLLTAIVLVWCEFLCAQSSEVSIDKKSNYDSWGTNWDSVVVLTNSIVTLAVVPKIGGRVMQYNLGTHASIYIDSALIGQIPTAYQTMGGFFTHASPQSSWNSAGWPPPPLLTQGTYASTILVNSPDSCSAYFESPIENTAGYSNLKGLQFKRTLTMFKASTRIKVAMTLVNRGTATLVPHGIWDVTESVGNNPGIAYDTMIWVYFPLNPSSTLGKGKGYISLQSFTDTTQWFRNAGGPGILGIQYKNKQSLLGADCKGGWICYIDRRTGYAYAKQFAYENGETYPDSGSSISVYTETNTPFLEVEVKGPLKALAPGDSITMAENWFAARSMGPVHWVNDAGIITRPLVAQSVHDSVRVQGAYGVFYTGYIKSLFVNSSGSIVSIGDSDYVTPLDSFVVNRTLKVPVNASKLILADYKSDGTFIGNLDSILLESTSTLLGGKTNGAIFNSDSRVTLRLHGGVIELTANLRERYTAEIVRFDGKRLAVFDGTTPQVFSVPMNGAAFGIYIIRIRLVGSMMSRTVFIGTQR